ncbi:putative phage-type endonuclease domain protein (plasmid) [Pseudomonas paraeruginosa]|nr:putative phage-type endonuclease domain protein [Pseudomonas paraeruginosa]
MIRLTRRSSQSTIKQQGSCFGDQHQRYPRRAPLTIIWCMICQRYSLNALLCSLSCSTSRWFVSERFLISTGDLSSRTPSNEARINGCSVDSAQNGKAILPYLSSKACSASGSNLTPLLTCGITDKSVGSTIPTSSFHSSRGVLSGFSPMITAQLVALMPSLRHSCHSGVLCAMSTIFIADPLVGLQQATGFKGPHLISPFLKFTTRARKPK